MCLLSLLMADSTFVTLPVLLSGGLPIRSAAGFPSRNLESNLYSKVVMHSCDVRVALLTLKFRVVSFWTHNKIVTLSAAPPVHMRSPFFSPLELALTCFNRMPSLRK